MNKQVIDIEKASSSIKLGMIIKEIDNIKRMLRCIYDKVNTPAEKKVDINLNKNIQTFAGLTVPSYIPDITGKQIYKMNKLGWTKEQICAISGFSPEEAKKKYEAYVRNNV
jgi:hypothetical protein